ncbi:response regulator transcription factor [Leeia sp.]|uniref:response regulator transcription factor n=1 Tax=Leeia sp. TaxID=2884678 RepID=UPI0035B30A79
MTRREREVGFWLAQGLSNKEVARQLGISDQTVRKHRENLLRKLGLNDGLQLQQFDWS